MIISKSIHVAANGIISFFLWLSNIPLLLCVCVCVCACIFFNHSFVNKAQFGCFHVLTTINSAAINTRVHVSFQVSFLQIYASLLNYVFLWPYWL